MAQQERPLRFAVVGCGALARSRHIPNIARSKKAVLHTCCDISEVALKACADTWDVPRTRTDWRETLRDPEVDAVVLATTEKLRLPVIRLAAELGKPIYVEKPIAKDLETLYQIQNAVRDAGIPFCAGHNRRNAPAMIEAHAIFRRHMEHPDPCPWRWDREPELKPDLSEDGVASFNCRINDDWYSWKAWVFDKTQAPHGPMLFEMTHFTDLCNWFLASRPVQVAAMETGMLNHAVIIRYETGELATINLCANGTFGYPKELYEAMGNGGIVVVDHMLEVRTAGIAGAPRRILYPMLEDRHPEIGREGGVSGWLAKKRAACTEVEQTGDPMKLFTAEPDKGHAHALDRFVDEIRGTGPVVCGVDDAVVATRVAFAAVRSARERRYVDLAEV
ncbi:MAG: Gfo/Idh/MocA family oxidoreductase [Kiritimatiellaeota bacterium]|nr:Gfo/Idh/MocA family oxidoreductase [Kiritimatiellota bacterium]